MVFQSINRLKEVFGCMVTSIPPHQRVKVDNLIVAGLWHGPTKPEMDSILEPILERISDLNINGILHSEIIIIPKLLMAVFDLQRYQY